MAEILVGIGGTILVACMAAALAGALLAVSQVTAHAVAERRWIDVAGGTVVFGVMAGAILMVAGTLLAQRY